MSLALIAGRGRLPELVAEAAGPSHVLSLEGQGPERLATRAFRIEHLGRTLDDLADAGVTRVCFAGAVGRPRIDATAIEPMTAPLVPRLATALGAGDDAALRTVLAIFEEAGLTPVAASALVPDLVPRAGQIGAAKPGPGDVADAERGRAVLAATGTVDLGQGCVVAGGLVLSVEALPGTDWMLDSVASLRGDGPLARPVPAGGVLVKAPKPGQDRRIDEPAIGPGTVARAVAAGLRGIAISPGVLVIDRAAAVGAADTAGLALWALEG